MELNVNTNTFYKGLDLDSDISILEKDTLRYAENIKLVANESGTQAAITNADYIQNIGINIPDKDNKKIIGVVDAKYHMNGIESNPVECVVVFTEHLQNHTNHVYVVDTNTKTIKQIVEGDFEFHSPLGLLSNYESPTISNVFIADGVNEIRCINIAKEYGKAEDTTMFDMTPASYLEAPRFVNLGNGNLRAGKYQYTYCLFSKNGSVSAMSSLSGMIPVSGTMGQSLSDKISGSKVEEYTGKSIKVKFSFINTIFDRVRIYRVFYEYSGQLPHVDIISEQIIKANKNIQTFEYIDYTNSSISTLTASELQTLFSKNIFSAKTIDTKDNILFAANIKEHDWDVEFDARAYRADENGTVVLNSIMDGSLKFNINDIPNISKEHDCLNESNIELFGNNSFKYVYNKDKKLGGTGINVSYEFVFTPVVLSNTGQTNEYSLNSLYLHAKQEENVAVKTYDINKNIVYTSDKHTIIRNYSDPYFCTNYTGYHRDEIYRFGIVFYNEKNIASPVHWIGDIRMPGPQLASSENSLLYPFHSNSHGPNHEGLNSDMIGYSLGVKFDVINIPSEVKRYQIVRCARDENNRTVAYQAAVNGLVSLEGRQWDDDGWQEITWLEQSRTIHPNKKTLFPQFILNTSDLLSVYNNHNDRADYQEYNITNDTFELISPEICVSKDNALLLTKGCKVCPVSTLYSYVGAKHNALPFKTGSFGVQSNVGYTLGVLPTKAYNMDGSLTDRIQWSYTWTYIKWLKTSSIYLGEPYSPGQTGLFRYTNVLPLQGSLNTYNITDTIAPKTISEIITFGDVIKSYADVINDNVFVNASPGSYNQWGLHGENLVISIDRNFDFLKSNKDSSIVPSQCMNRVVIANVKKQSGFVSDSYNMRTNSIYIPCVNHFVDDSCICYGGDTYLTVLDYLNTSFVQEENDYNSRAEFRLHTQCYIPFETTVNANLFSNPQYHTTLTDKMIGNNLIQHQPVAQGSHIQKEPQYQYNAAYSQQSNAISYIPKSIYSEDDITYMNRILASEPKTNMEITNSWLVFKVANYLDVQNKWGQITNLKNFNNHLYFFQDTALGIAAVNDRALVATNINELALGTGGVLERFDYVTTTNGTSIVNDKSIVQSSTSLYWYDPLKNTLCVHQQGVQELSKLKKVQSHFNGIDKEDRMNSVSLFNKKYDEIWFNVANKALIYSEPFGVFTSFSSHDYDNRVMLSDRVITLNGNEFFNHNDFVNTSNSVQPMISKFNIVVNDKFIYPKVFDNVMFYADFNGNINNITELIFKTKNQVTEPISAENIECREDTYRFAIPREKKTDESDHLSYLGRMRGNYIEAAYTLDCNDGQTFKIPYIKTTYRQSRL